MNIQILKTGTDHEEVAWCEDPKSGLRSIIAIYSTALGPALGGVRMLPYRSREEALYDVLRLSRAMTYKAAVSGLELGGGKGVIIGDPERDKTPELFRAFGRFVESREGRYITAKDMGTTTDDLTLVAEETRHVGGLPLSMNGSGDPSPMTAYGVYQGIQASVKERLGKDSLRGVRVAIQGVGHVGFGLARHLHREGADLIAADTDARNTARAEKDLGARIVSPEAILKIPADVLAPCARGGVLNPQTIEALQVSIVAGGANNQLEDEWRDGDLLFQKGILYAPDYVINAGGIINIFCERGGYSEEKAKRKTEGIRDTLLDVFRTSRETNTSPSRVALRLAENRIRSGGRPTPGAQGASSGR